jgi:hydrogenase nickel incorporation protein HypA/HybF
MHEIGFIDNIISAIKVNVKNLPDGSSIKKVNIIIGELEDALPTHLEYLFREKTKGTLLKDVQLHFKKVEARFRCRYCKDEFSSKAVLDRCPKCNNKIIDLIAGKGVSVESVEVAEGK